MTDLVMQWFGLRFWQFPVILTCLLKPEFEADSNSYIVICTSLLNINQCSNIPIYYIQSNKIQENID